MATAIGVMVGWGVALFGTGLWLTVSDTCTGGCSRLGLVLLYAGGPVSAIFGVIGGAVMAAWPADLILWVTLAFAVTKVAERRGRGPVWVAVPILGAALVIGAGLSLLVEPA